jgi:hypothetical protein
MWRAKLFKANQRNFFERIFIYLVISFMTLILTPFNPAMAQTEIPVCSNEPPPESQVSWNNTPTGLLIKSYDQDNNCKADFHTLLVILQNYRSGEDTYQMQQNNPENQVFFVEYTADRHYYIAAKNPLFYGFDVNEDGHWDLVCKDVLEDGVNGNEFFLKAPLRCLKLPLINQPFPLTRNISEIELVVARKSSRPSNATLF